MFRLLKTNIGKVIEKHSNIVLQKKNDIPICLSICKRLSYTFVSVFSGMTEVKFTFGEDGREEEAMIVDECNECVNVDLQEEVPQLFCTMS